ncbi:two-component system response regulator [Roseivirga echinicomitans]|uniref:Two-component system response regulator n=2 Tax=Roseivirga echinicomitans TaxID=296218 RepID=A0A150X3E1_9BACT|nr:two-component system response regulator [Roseivirga echinicomitans]
MIRVAIAEDHQSLIDGLKLQLERIKEISVVGTANDGEALLNIIKLKRPDVVITDIRMPKIDGIVVTSMIKKEFPEIRVLAFTMFDQNEAVQQMLDAGASGYVLKKSSLKEVIEAIKAVYRGEKYFDANIQVGPEKGMDTKTKKGVLTNRQKEILNLVAQGLTSREIADMLFIGVFTVETHRRNMVRILGLKGNGELLRYAIEKKYDFN